MTHKSKERTLVEHIFASLPAGEGLTLLELNARAGFDCRRIINNMQQRGSLMASHSGGRNRNARYTITTPTAKWVEKALNPTNEKQRLWSSGQAAKAADDVKKKPAAASAHGAGPVLTTPVNGPGYTPSRHASGIQAHSRAKAGPAPIATTGDPYKCPELRVNPGITADRLVAFALPSRRGNRLHFPDGRVEVLA